MYHIVSKLDHIEQMLQTYDVKYRGNNTPPSDLVEKILAACERKYSWRHNLSKDELRECVKEGVDNAYRYRVTKLLERFNNSILLPNVINTLENTLKKHIPEVDDKEIFVILPDNRQYFKESYNFGSPDARYVCRFTNMGPRVDGDNTNSSFLSTHKISYYLFSWDGHEMYDGELAVSNPKTFQSFLNYMWIPCYFEDDLEQLKELMFRYDIIDYAKSTEKWNESHANILEEKNKVFLDNQNIKLIPQGQKEVATFWKQVIATALSQNTTKDMVEFLEQYDSTITILNVANLLLSTTPSYEKFKKELKEQKYGNFKTFDFPVQIREEVSVDQFVQILNNSFVYCRSRISPSFVRDVVSKDNLFIMTAREDKTVYAFVLVEKKHKNMLYLHLICSSLPQLGKVLFNKVLEWAATRKMNIKLSAINKKVEEIYVRVVESNRNYKVKNVTDMDTDFPTEEQDTDEIKMHLEFQPNIQ